MGERMINKQGLIFLTLTSLILVLSVYYVTMPNELLLTTNNSYIANKDNKEKQQEEKKNTSEKTEVVINDSTVTEAMKSVLTDERQKKLKELNEKLTKKDLSMEEKNNIYEEIKVMNKLSSMEEEIEKLIKTELNLDSFVKVSDDVIEITIKNSKHDANLAVKIMTLVEKQYKDTYVSVSFKE